MISLGDRLKLLRLEQGLTQQELSDILHVARSTLGSYETNAARPSDEVKFILCDYFNVSLDYLNGLSNTRQNFESYDLDKNIYMHVPVFEDLTFKNEVSKMLAKRSEASDKHVYVYSAFTLPEKRIKPNDLLLINRSFVLANNDTIIVESSNNYFCGIALKIGSTLTLVNSSMDSPFIQFDIDQINIIGVIISVSFCL